MMKLIRSQQGSMTSLMIVVGIMSVAVVGLMRQNQQTEKAITSSKEHLSTQEVINSITQDLNKASGCSKFLGAKLNHSIPVSSSSANGQVVATKTINKTQLKQLTYTKFTPTTADASTGIAEFTATLSEASSKRNIKRKFHVLVSVDANKSITECHQNSATSIDKIYQALCAGTFGSKTIGMNCQDSIALVKNIAMNEVCDELFGGPGKGKFKNGHCDLKLLNANKACVGSFAMNGFDHQGKIKCKNL